MGPKIRFAINASFAVYFGLFAIQLYAVIPTGSSSVEWLVSATPYPVSSIKSCFTNTYHWMFIYTRFCGQTRGYLNYER